MSRSLLCLSAVLILQSCIPLRIAPTIEEYKITKGKKFKRSLSKRQMFIFEDPKDAEHFYNYVNTKYELEHIDVYDDIPFVIDGQQYFFAWYEIEIADKTLHLAPAMIDVIINGALGNEEFEPYVMENSQNFTRTGNWYIAIEVYSDLEKDCLQSDSLSQEVVLKYLSALKEEYLSTQNYNEVVFKN